MASNNILVSISAAISRPRHALNIFAGICDLLRIQNIKFYFLLTKNLNPKNFILYCSHTTPWASNILNSHQFQRITRYFEKKKMFICYLIHIHSTANKILAAKRWLFILIQKKQKKEHDYLCYKHCKYVYNNIAFQ